jgi:hypothetical protein
MFGRPRTALDALAGNRGRHSSVDDRGPRGQGPEFVPSAFRVAELPAAWLRELVFPCPVLSSPPRLGGLCAGSARLSRGSRGAPARSDLVVCIPATLPSSAPGSSEATVSSARLRARQALFSLHLQRRPSRPLLATTAARIPPPVPSRTLGREGRG